ncbi:hypothetical protein [Lactococcus phage CHPC971]|uniref:Uncharacterized protein n=2 Tax=Fremauxvirus CHPC971 TaxID=2845405 RepID=A0A649V3H9_9CAUD|nr:hypothetical protein KMD16_gp26 [Lactococcus phage CHPC971]QCW07628.1 hypothetical protein [Lactococcus phage CHPC971]QGJ84776.1 hypothetical protein [Lactococcus phage P1046]
MKFKTLKSLKAEREALINKLSNVESKEAKEFIMNEIEELDFKIEGKIEDNQRLIDISIFAATSVIGTMIINKWKK